MSSAMKDFLLAVAAVLVALYVYDGYVKGKIPTLSL